jgi:hypothetical protein
MLDIVIITKGSLLRCTGPKFTLKKTACTIKEKCQSRSFSLLLKHESTVKRIKYAVKYYMNHYIEWRLMQTKQMTRYALSCDERKDLAYYAHLYRNKQLITLVEQHVIDKKSLFGLYECICGAIKSNDLEKTKQYIDMYKQSDQKVSLHFVPGYCTSIEMLQYLQTVEPGCIANTTYQFKHRRIEFISYIIDNLPPRCSRMCLHSASKIENVQVAMQVFDLLEKKNMFVLKEAIHGACQANNLQLLQILEKRITNEEIEWEECIAQALQYNTVRVIQYIFQHYKINKILLLEILDKDMHSVYSVQVYACIKEQLGNTTIPYCILREWIDDAALDGKLDLVVCLLKELEHDSEFNECSLLDSACSEGHLDIVKHLMLRYMNNKIIGKKVKYDLDCLADTALVDDHYNVFYYLVEEHEKHLDDKSKSCCSSDNISVLQAKRVNSLLMAAANINSLLLARHAIRQGATKINEALQAAKTKSNNEMMEYLQTLK